MKNRKFKNSYLITVEGVTTNGMQAEILDMQIKAFVNALSRNLGIQTKIVVELTESSGDYKPIMEDK